MTASGPSHRRGPLATIGAAMSAYPLLIDLAIAFGLLGLSLLSVAAGAPDIGLQGGALSLLLLQTLPLILRRRYPAAVLLVVVGATFTQAVIAESSSLRSGLGAIVAVFSVAERLDRRHSAMLAAATAAVLGFAVLMRIGFPASMQSIIQTSLTIGAAWFAGDWGRTRRLYLRALESEREERALREIAEERERIARELHDVVTHHVSVIVIQAGAGLQVIDRRPAEARSTLEAIAATGRQALADMRRMFGIIGNDDAHVPMPRLEQLGELLEQVRSAGLEVELSVQGQPRELDPGLELSAYRIIQEALTNSLKHAHGARARVEVRYEPGWLDLAIVDRGGRGGQEPVEEAHDGRGLTGMRQRAAMFGGTLEAHPTTTGFRVAVRLPVDARAQA